MPHLPVAEASAKNSIDLKANGEVSRMRSHKGNMPSLPQTKYCALCPAKFTRTTHLNRHLRSHTNERAHRCNVCNAEFTRSDLLTRHKRTCGDSSNVNRSRRKSCQACAESKVKCNLQQPCSKCSSRGRECIFINDPAAARNKKAAKKSPRSQLSLTPSETDPSESATSLDSLVPSSPSSTFSFSSHGPDTHSYLVSSSHFVNNHLLPGPSFGMPGVPSISESSSSACSSRSSPRLDYFYPRKVSNSFSMGFNTLALDSELNDFFPNTADPFVDDAFSPCLPRVQTDTNLSGWFETGRTCAAYGNNEPPIYAQSHCQDNQDFVTGSTNLTLSSLGKSPFLRQHPSTARQPFCPSSASGNPTTEELNHYLYLFFSEFSIQIPLFHRPTWRMETTHPILLTAMQACGALFAKTPSSMDYLIQTLTSSRDSLILEFSKPTCTLKDHIGLILAAVLLQSIGLLQSRPDQRALSKVYHDILVMMIRKTGLIKFVSSWPSPDLSSSHLLENAWRDWARYETFKRALVFAYLQDCMYSVYYSSPPAFLPSEFEINLPSDDDLWRAPSAREWYQMQNMGTNYGMGRPRILGTSMQSALAALKEHQFPMAPFTVNPFSAFLLVHSLLREIFSSSQNAVTATTSPGAGNPLSIQRALHNWQRLWSDSPGCMHSQRQQNHRHHSVPYVHNAIPFYWLARLAEGAKQNGELHIRPLSSKEDFDDRYRTVKGWLGQINATLCSTAGSGGGGSHFSPDLSLSPLGLSVFSHAS
ncbi:fungal-specific transcription factor domain-containing protein [Gymnopilus junonius]|uniref:Fungal-specific transcription factor domain-containing protein n=1 Tax=Gymnopilus junonius TaxID=109634 RepID=A0A9P5TKF5_GYMJU|nr:fungal-specific transcription factor domain-containing protein [Gymnopilus junonius]